MIARIRERATKALAGVGLVTVAGLTAYNFSVSSKVRQARKIPEKSLIHFDLSIPIVETQPPPLAALFNPGSSPISLRSVIESIRKAASDDRIKGILCTFGAGAQPSIATVQEIRTAILEFREAQKALPPANQKFVWVAADTFGNSEPTAAYSGFQSLCECLLIQVKLDRAARNTILRRRSTRYIYSHLDSLGCSESRFKITFSRICSRKSD